MKEWLTEKLLLHRVESLARNCPKNESGKPIILKKTTDSYLLPMIRLNLKAKIRIWENLHLAGNMSLTTRGGFVDMTPHSLIHFLKELERSFLPLILAWTIFSEQRMIEVMRYHIDFRL